jgi:putative restriction endonuclease
MFLRRRISSIYKYKKTNRISDPDPQIGCIILTMPFYLEEDDWITVPDNWSKNIVQGKTYDTSEHYGKLLYQQIQEVLYSQRFNKNLLREDSVNSRYGKEQKIKPRIGQGAFKILITDAYHRRCAITGEKTLPVLEAAHIKPFSLDGPHEINNGLLLRRDFHTLFDRGYITIDKEFNVEVSRRIKEDFGNGKEYYAHHGSKLIILPGKKEQLPSPHYLEWHNENIYLG